MLSLFENIINNQLNDDNIDNIENNVLELFHLHLPLLRKICSYSPEAGLFQNTLFGTTIQLIDKLNYNYLNLKSEYNKLLEEKANKDKLSYDSREKEKAVDEAEKLKKQLAQTEVDLSAYQKRYKDTLDKLNAYKRTRGYNPISWNADMAESFFKKVDEMEDVLALIEQSTKERVSLITDLNTFVNDVKEVKDYE